MTNSIEVLVATTNQKDHTLLSKMNIQTDAIVANQCDRNVIENFVWKDCKIRYLNFCEKGVGLNRNNALMRATADYCVFADDDMVFYDNYSEIVSNTFASNEKADILIFNIDEVGATKRRKNKKIKKIGIFNYFNYGAARIAVRRKDVQYKGINFNLNFGGGTKHSSGEDTLFLRDCLRSGLKIFAIPISIAKLEESRESTWFNGYNEKYFYDAGIVLGIAHPILCQIMIVYLTLKHKDFRISGEKGIWPVIKAYRKGIKYSKKRKS